MDNMIRAFKKLHDFQRGFDGAADVLEQTIGRSICISGCGRCCQISTVMCMTIEGMNAVSVLMGDPRYKKIIALSEGWLLEHHREAPTYKGMLAGRFVPPDINEELIALRRLPCPFLAENKQCIIHEARPLVCRSFGVTHTDAAICPRPVGKGETLTQLMYINSPDLRGDIQRFKETYRKERPDWVTFGLLPTILYRAAKETQFRKMVADNQIATAKLIGTDLDTTLMWQPQLDALNLGISPDVVVSMT
jgi:Fe-S-cluster containining protein